MNRKILAVYFSAGGITALTAKNLAAEWKRPMKTWTESAL